MYISTVRLYHPALWKISYSYRVVLVAMRVFENLSHLMFYCCLQGPPLIAWTRFPVTRGQRPPIWRSLAAVVAPIEGRASLAVGGGQMGSDFALAGSTHEIASIQNAIVGSQKPPPAFYSVTGSFMRGMFTAMGPAFIKFGQIMSMREELPHAIRIELSLLQDKLPPMSFKTVKRILERELDRPLDEVFEYVEETPIAAASLAQVHRARLLKEQEDVALKIQRPYLQGTVALDTVYLCDIVIGLIKMMLPTLAKGADFGVFTQSYREQLAKEIDFVLEERTQGRYRKFVMDHPIYCQGTKIAKTYREYTTTKLLTMELVKNYYRLDRILDDLTPQQLMEFANTKIDGLPPELPLQLLWTQVAIVFDGLSHWGLSHGDIHLGNIYALAPENEGDHWRMFLCDFGMMIEQTAGERIMAIESGLSIQYYWDGAILGRALVKQSLKPVPHKNVDRLIDAAATVVDKYMIEVEEGKEKVYHTQIQRGSKNNQVSELVYAAATMGLKMAPGNWLFLKNFGYLVNMTGSICTSVNSTNMWMPHCKKYLKDIIMHDMETKNIANIGASLPEMLSMLREYDRKQILSALDGKGQVEPLGLIWAHNWDVRGLRGANRPDLAGL
jgi:predicted unusual protein kinase regulating ubiquinone biosynthesis (AarF/ABC1/UbiB family)